MKKLILPLVLIVVGALIMVGGQRRADSVKGMSDSVATKIANAWDGKERQPEHLWYAVGGGALILAGLVLALKKNPGT